MTIPGRTDGQPYRIGRVIGNNYVLAQDEDGHEIILRGLGIGFKKQPGDLVPARNVERIYAMRDPEQSSRLSNLLSDVPPEFLDVSTEIIELAEKQLGRRLSENVYITLTDHICFAVERLRNGISYPNQLLWEITNFYPGEYALGEQALEIIEQRLGFRLARDEAGFIALHLVNAEIDGRMSDMVRITQLIRTVVEIVESYYQCKLDEQSLDYGRFITHLKFLGQRMTQNRYAPEDDNEFQSMVARRYRYDFQCAQQIREHLKETLGICLPPEEITFLTVHLHRLGLSMGFTKKED